MPLMDIKNQISNFEI